MPGELGTVRPTATITMSKTRSGGIGGSGKESFLALTADRMDEA